jgi:uncharacterized membrane protein
MLRVCLPPSAFALCPQYSSGKGAISIHNIFLVSVLVKAFFALSNITAGKLANFCRYAEFALYFMRLSKHFYAKPQFTPFALLVSSLNSVPPSPII